MPNERNNTSLQWLLNDPIYEACLRMSVNPTGGKRQSYGAILVDPQGTILSIARNIIVRADEPWRKMGYANHAEGMAIFMAEVFGRKVAGARLYVGGVLEDGTPFIHSQPPRFTCTRCASLVQEYDLAGIHIPTVTGWQFLDTMEVRKTAREFKQNTKDNSSGRTTEAVTMNRELATEIKRQTLRRQPADTIRRLRDTGMRVTREAAAVLGLTTNGYIPEEQFKSTAISLIRDLPQAKISPSAPAQYRPSANI